MERIDKLEELLRLLLAWKKDQRNITWRPVEELLRELEVEKGQE